MSVNRFSWTSSMSRQSWILCHSGWTCIASSAKMSASPTCWGSLVRLQCRSMLLMQTLFLSHFTSLTYIFQVKFMWSQSLREIYVNSPWHEIYVNSFTYWNSCEKIFLIFKWKQISWKSSEIHMKMFTWILLYLSFHVNIFTLFVQIIRSQVTVGYKRWYMIIGLQKCIVYQESNFNVHENVFFRIHPLRSL